MYLAKVTGTVVASTKADGLDCVKLLIVEPVDEEGRAVGPPQVAADAVQAGAGELVFVCTGREGALALDEVFAPVDLAVVGHVDDVDAREPIQTPPGRPAPGGTPPGGTPPKRRRR